jgi:dephospho-CoA kinase
MLPSIVAICGVKRAGKDTVANILCDEYGYTNIKVAEGLKDMLKLLFAFTDGQLETDEKDIICPRWGVTPRSLMQFFGTEIMQYELSTILPHVGRRFWIMQLINKHIAHNPSKRFVISDMRFVHEYESLLPFSPFVIKVDRNISTQYDAHISEQEFTRIPTDWVVNNNNDINALKNDILVKFDSMMAIH